MDQVGFWRHPHPNEQPMAAMDSLFLYRYDERVHDRQGCRSMGKSLRQQELRRRLPTELLPRKEIP